MGDLKTLNETFGQTCLEQFKRLAPPETAPAMLYHYTTTAGMLAIVNSGVMWAHNIERQNDYAEVRYAGSVLRGHLDRAWALESDPGVLSLYDAMRRYMSTITMEAVFLLSFTGNGDEPGMWGLYSDRGQGFSFAIDVAPALSWDGIFLKCQYDADALDEYCKETISNVKATFLANGGVADGAALGDYVAMFFRHIVWFAPMFKPRVWSDEQEWRLLFVRQPEYRKVREDGRTHIVLPPEGRPHLAIRAICAGPACDHENSIVPVQRAMNERGLNIPLYVSKDYRARPGRTAPPLLPTDSSSIQTNTGPA